MNLSQLVVLVAGGFLIYAIAVILPDALEKLAHDISYGNSSLELCVPSFKTECT